MSGERPWRCFVAVPIGAELRRELQAAVAAWRAVGTPAELRWSEPEAWHLTIAFLGATSPRDVPRIAERLAVTVADHAAFRQATGGLGAFPSVSAARVLWYGVDDSEHRLASLARAVRSSVEVPGTSRFRPHLTLARLRRPASLRDWLGQAEAPDGQLVIDRVHLYRSLLGSGPPRYEVLSEVALVAGAPAGSGTSG